jgi:RHS repeat-associated protein
VILQNGQAAFVDRLGSDRRNTRYYPYGKEYTATGNDKDKFATYFRDSSTGLDYAMNRYYGSNLGRFLTPDPYGGSAKPDNPQTWNRYSYVTNDPINANDPSGRDPLPVDPYQGLIDLAIGRDRIDQELLIQLSDRFARKALNNFQGFVLRQNFKAFLDEMSNDCKRELAPYISGLRSGVDTVMLYDVNYWGNTQDFAQTEAYHFFGLKAVDEANGDRFTPVGEFLASA